MNQQQIEAQIIRSSRIEGWVSVVSLVAAGIGYFLLPHFRVAIGSVGVLVWGFYACLYLFQVGPGRSWLGAFLPACVAFLFATWFIRG